MRRRSQGLPAPMIMLIIIDFLGEIEQIVWRNYAAVKSAPIVESPRVLLADIWFNPRLSTAYMLSISQNPPGKPLNHYLLTFSATLTAG